jgi:hypothetical protein
VEDHPERNAGVCRKCSAPPIIRAKGAQQTELSSLADRRMSPAHLLKPSRPSQDAKSSYARSYEWLIAIRWDDSDFDHA